MSHLGKATLDAKSSASIVLILVVMDVALGHLMNFLS